MKWNGIENERMREKERKKEIKLFPPKHGNPSRKSATTTVPLPTSQVVATPHVDPTHPSPISYALGDISSNSKMNNQITPLGSDPFIASIVTLHSINEREVQKEVK